MSDDVDRRIREMFVGLDMREARVRMAAKTVRDCLRNGDIVAVRVDGFVVVVAAWSDHGGVSIKDCLK